jgi:hypothetical protein
MDMARRDDWRVPMIPVRPHQDAGAVLLRHVDRVAEDMGVKWVNKPMGGASQAVGSTIYLGTNYGKKPDHDKAAHKAHELVHILHQRDVGLAKWLAKYARDPRWRWSAEMVATREQMRWLKRAGVSPAGLRDYAERKADKARKTWNLWRVKGSDVHGRTLEVLTEVI